MEKTPDCPECGKKLILAATGVAFPTDPPIHQQVWWCACGFNGPAPERREMTAEQIRLREWERLNVTSG